MITKSDQPPPGPPGVQVVAFPAVEMLARLYAYAHTVQGDFVPAPARVAAPPQGHDRAIAWFFGDDFSLGMNLAVLAVQRGWSDADALVHAVRHADIGELVSALLRPPSIAPTQLRRREHLVARICAGAEADIGGLVAQCVADGFESGSVRRLLQQPASAVAELLALLEAVAADYRGAEEESVLERLTAATAAIHEDTEADWTEASRVAELSRVTGGWTLKDAEKYHITLAPCEAIRPFLIARVVTGQSAIVICGGAAVTTRSAVDLADALKVLGNIQRLNILRNVATLPATGQDLAELLGLSEATVHHHTSALRSAGLITSEREGVRVYHHATRDRINDLLDDVRRTVFGG